MARRRSYRVRFSDHAVQRMHERGRNKKITPQMVAKKMAGMMPNGVPVKDMAVEIPVNSRLMAVCVPEITGGWRVVTFKRRKRRKRTRNDDAQ